MKKFWSIILFFAALTACQETCIKPVTVVPYPNEVTLNAGTFNAQGADFHYDEAFEDYAKNAIEAFAGSLALAGGKDCKVAQGKSNSGFVFIMNNTLPEEAYKLTVSRKAVTVEAASLNGVIYAIETLKQMLPVEVYGKEVAADANWTIQCCDIYDEPRFGYRGALLDEGRYFFGVDAVKRYLDIMAFHKLNVFHWHLTEDCGWRIEIKKYPKLTEVGSIRKQTLVGHVSRSNVYDGKPYGEGLWYTQEQIKEVVEYAASKGITIIPEIDVPGHLLAALAAYPELGCTGGPYEVGTKWVVYEDVLCVGKESALKFVEDVLSEVCELFPGEYIHIGGDECPKVRWEKCPHCQAKIRELGLTDKNGHTAEQYLQSYFTARMEKFLEGKGKKIIGWDEILEGELSPNATVMAWRDTESGHTAARLGHDAIMVPLSHLYLDFYQHVDNESEPLAIGGFISLEKCYSFEPGGEHLTKEEQEHIIGVQANLWMEYISTEPHIYYMLLPRLAAASETMWCNRERKDWNRFYESADEFCAIYDAMGYDTYCTHVFNAKEDVRVNREKSIVEVALSAHGDAPIRYTLDGSEPDESSTLYTEPVAIEGTCTLKAASFRPGKKTKPVILAFAGHKAMGSPITGNSTPLADYAFNFPDNLVDGIRGRGDYGSGEWVGFHDEPLDVTLQMDGNTPYTSVTIGTFLERLDQVMNPSAISVSVSDDGKDFREVAKNEYAPVGPDGKERITVNYTMTFPETTAKYIHVTVEPQSETPSWHKKKGTPTYLYIDEILVK